MDPLNQFVFALRSRLPPREKAKVARLQRELRATRLTAPWRPKPSPIALSSPRLPQSIPNPGLIAARSAGGVERSAAIDASRTIASFPGSGHDHQRNPRRPPRHQQSAGPAVSKALWRADRRIHCRMMPGVCAIPGRVRAFVSRAAGKDVGTAAGPVSSRLWRRAPVPRTS